MINKFFLAIIISVTLAHCGFSPVYIGNSKQVIISKSEIVGDKDLVFNLEQKLNFKKDENNLNAYIFKAQIYDTTESSLVDARGISTEEIIKLTGTSQKVVYHPLPVNDPLQRQPDTTKAKNLLGWEAKVSREEGMKITYDYFKSLSKEELLKEEHKDFSGYIK